MRVKEQILRFWRSENDKVAIVRDILVALFAVFIVLLLLWGYTGQWLAAPMVAIESGSMEHSHEPYGRYGTINAGDMVLVQKVASREDVITRGGDFAGALATKDPANYFYGDYGDVVIYHPDGDMEDTQIIHRAMCWVDVIIDENGDKRYTIAEYGLYNQTFLNLRELGLGSNPEYYPDWSHSGYLTKGDNYNVMDQAGGIAKEPVKVKWTSGKARLEIPWIGTINLYFEDLLNPGQPSTVANVHTDCLVCLVIVIAILVSIPIAMDLYDYVKQKKMEQP